MQTWIRQELLYILENDVISQSHLLEHYEKYRFPTKLHPLSFSYTGINIQERKANISCKKEPKDATKGKFKATKSRILSGASGEINPSFLSYWFI